MLYRCALTIIGTILSLADNDLCAGYRCREGDEKRSGLVGMSNTVFI